MLSALLIYAIAFLLPDTAPPNAMMDTIKDNPLPDRAFRHSWFFSIVWSVRVW